MASNMDIIFEKKAGKNGFLGIITLNRPQVLNALNHAMFLSLTHHLKQWEHDEEVKAVIITAVEGRAFCAGGDIRSAYERGKAGDAELPNFFTDEYRLNQIIYHYPKPYIALLDGITMGGGAGISLHGSLRIATERLIFAMPETGIGFFPDVGASYFLSRLPGKMGLYLGLSSARINHYDCLQLGLVDFVIKHDMVNQVIPALLQYTDFTALGLTSFFKNFMQPKQTSALLAHQDEIDFCFSKNSIEDIIIALENYSSDWCKEVAQQLKIKSPTSLKVTFKQLQLGAKLDFDACIEMESLLASHFIKGHDFYSGIKSVVIDKGQPPIWKPAYLHEVTMQDINHYFEK
jgi:enoyl-CoA hydratase